MLTAGVSNANCYEAFEDIINNCFNTDSGQYSSFGTGQSSEDSIAQFYQLWIDYYNLEDYQNGGSCTYGN